MVEIKGKTVRLQILPEDSRTGKPFLSPWVQVQESAGDDDGGYSTHVPIAVGETMRLLSPHGELGPQSIAIRDGYTKRTRSRPRKTRSWSSSTATPRIRMNGERIEFAVGDSAVRISADEVRHHHPHPPQQRQPQSPLRRRPRQRRRHGRRRCRRLRLKKERAHHGSQGQNIASPTRPGRYVAGHRAKPGDVLSLTEEQARYALITGELEPDGKARP